MGVAFAHLSAEKVQDDKKMRLYNDIWYIRWALFSVISLIWPNYPLLLSIIWTGVDFLLFLYAILTLGGFKGISGILIVFEELFVFLWHLGLVFLYYNFQKDDPFGDFWYNWFNYFVLTGFCFSLLIEIVLAFIGFGKEKETPGMVKTMDFEFQDFSEEEKDHMDMKLKSYYSGYNERKLKYAMREIGKKAWAGELGKAKKEDEE